MQICLSKLSLACIIYGRIVRTERDCASQRIVIPYPTEPGRETHIQEINRAEVFNDAAKSPDTARRINRLPTRL